MVAARWQLLQRVFGSTVAKTPTSESATFSTRLGCEHTPVLADAQIFLLTPARTPRADWQPCGYACARVGLAFQVVFLLLLLVNVVNVGGATTAFGDEAWALMAVTAAHAGSALGADGVAVDGDCPPIAPGFTGCDP